MSSRIGGDGGGDRQASRLRLVFKAARRSLEDSPFPGGAWERGMVGSRAEPRNSSVPGSAGNEEWWVPGRSREIPRSQARPGTAVSSRLCLVAFRFQAEPRQQPVPKAESGNEDNAVAACKALSIGGVISCERTVLLPRP